MKKLLLFVFALFLSSGVFAEGIKEMVFFGDSLSDNGRLYNLFQTIPRSPPYYNGRFSNGPVWSEIVGEHYKESRSLSYSVYAIGGATTFVHKFSDIFTFTLDHELLDYYAQYILADHSKTLYSLWIGANDYLKEAMDKNALPSPEEIEKLTTKVVELSISTLNDLKNQGGRYFLVMNLPDLGATPYAAQNGLKEILHLMSTTHNQKLAQAITDFAAQNPDRKVIFFDTGALFDDLLQHPEKYNQAYQADIKNLSEACWMGGFGLTKPGKMDKLINSPALLEAYRVGRMKENNLKPCDNPDQYVFWDPTHPTEAIHKILSTVAIQTLDQQSNDLFG